MYRVPFSEKLAIDFNVNTCNIGIEDDSQDQYLFSTPALRIRSCALANKD
jgi:hypothetical protein